MQKLKPVIITLLLLLLSRGAYAEDTSCKVFDPLTGTVKWDGVRCAVDLNSNGVIDDCSELFVCSKPKSAGWCDKSTDPVGYKCISTGKFYLPTGFNASGIDAANTIFVAPGTEYSSCNNYDPATGSGCPDQTCTPVWSYTCSKDSSVYASGELCQSSCGGQCSCSPGGFYNEQTGLCEVESTNPCPSNIPYNPQYGSCAVTISCPPGSTYSQETNTCTTNTSYTCPPGFTYNSSTGRCQALPQCPNGTFYNKTSDKCETVTCPKNYSFNSDKWRCERASDCGVYTLNPATNLCEESIGICTPGDPADPQTDYVKIYMGQAEDTTCSCSNCVSKPLMTDVTEVPATYICIGQYKVNFLPNEFKGTGWCNYDHYIVYGKPYYCDRLNNTTDKDTCDSTCPCPVDFTADPLSHLCTKSPCKAGETIDSSANVCWIEPTVWGGGTCPVNYTSTNGRCESSYACEGTGTYNPQTGKCETQGTAVCQSPYTAQGQYCVYPIYCNYNPSGLWNPTRDRCEQVTPYYCEDGYTYSSTLNRCIADYTCPPGSSWNQNAQTCVQPQSPNSCDAGYSWSTQFQRCIADYTCPSGTTWNQNAQTCIAPGASGSNCTSFGYIYNASTSRCETSPRCSQSGTFNISRQRCEFNGTTNCPPDFIWNAPYCEQTPSCSGSGTYNQAIHACTTPTEESCPLGAYPCSAGQCAATANCNAVPVVASISGGASLALEIKSFAAAADGKGMTFTQSDGKTYVVAFTGCQVAGAGNLTGTQSITAASRTITFRDANNNQLAAINITGCTVSGSGTGAAYGPIANGGNTLDFISAAVTFTPDNSVLYQCPLDNAIVCTTDPVPTCSAATSCQASCPAGYALSGPECTAAAGCPSGGVLNTQRDMCQMNYAGTISCPPGTVADLTLGICYYLADCPNGGTLDAANGLCYFSQCPANYTWCNANAYCIYHYNWNIYVYSAYGAPGCFANETVQTCPATPNATLTSKDTYRCYETTGGVCPANFKWCDANAYCIYHYNWNIYVYSAYGAPGCFSNETVPMCPPAVQGVTKDVYRCYIGTGCLYGYTLDQANKVCYQTANPTCPSPGAINTSIDKCSAPPTKIVCPTGYTWSGTGQVCQKDPTCPSATSPTTGAPLSVYFDTGKGVCWTCADGFIFNVSTGTCQADPYCQEGTVLNPDLDVCESVAEISCPTGTTYQPSTGLCISPAACPSPQCSEGCWSKTLNRCDPTAALPCQFIDTYDPISKMCRLNGTPECPTDYTFEPSSAKCLQPAVCPPTDWVCPKDTDPICTESSPYGNKNWKDTSNGAGTSYVTFATTVNPMSYSQFVTNTTSLPGYEAPMATLADKDDIWKYYGTGPFWIKDAILYQDVYLNIFDCSYQDFITSSPPRKWRPKDFALTGICGNPNLSWERYEESCVCKTIKKETFTRTCSGISFTEALTDTQLIPSNMSSCTADPVPTCTAGLDQQGLNKCDINQEDFSGSIACDGNPYAQTRVLTTCAESTPAIIPVEYRSVSSLRGIVKWNGVKCTPCLTSDQATDDDVPSGEEQPIDQTQQCTDFKVFSGHDRRCVPSALATLFTNCCNLSGWFKSWCNNEERELKKRRQGGTCTEVGDYCAKRILGVCIKKKKTYCCFNSKLARIINEQGRPQIGKSFGSAKYPDCEGLTPEELSKLDFSQMDLSEYVNDVQSEMNTSGSQLKAVEGMQNWLNKQGGTPANRSFGPEAPSTGY